MADPTELLARWRQRPDAFMEEVFGIIAWDRQREVIEAVRDSDRVAVRSGHKVSKSNTLAGLALWFVCCYPGARVPITNSSFGQVRKINWHEIKNLYRRAEQRGCPIGGNLHEDPASGLTFDDGREVFGFSTREPERAAGISGENILYLIDEASGVPEDVFEAMEGNRAGGAKMALFSNPTRVTGTFYNAFHGKREFWKTVHISSAETPNAKAGRKIIPGLATREWIDEKRAEWGPESPIYQVRVEGNFPSQSEQAVIGLYLVEEARERYDELMDAIAEAATRPEPLRLGVDPARYGDDESAVQPVRGPVALPAKTFRGLDGVQLAGHVLDTVVTLRAQLGLGEYDTVEVNVDVIGIGASCFDQLAHSDRARALRVVVRPVNVSERADDEDAYAGLRTQITFALRDWLMDGGMIPEDGKLEAELVVPEYGFDSRGRYKLSLDKDGERKLLGRSPDRRDALALAVYHPPRSAAGSVQVAAPRSSYGGTIADFMGG